MIKLGFNYHDVNVRKYSTTLFSCFGFISITMLLHFYLNTHTIYIAQSKHMYIAHFIAH